MGLTDGVEAEGLAGAGPAHDNVDGCTRSSNAGEEVSLFGSE